MVNHTQKAILIAATTAFAMMFCPLAQAGVVLPTTQTFLSGTVTPSLTETDLYLVYWGSSSTGTVSDAVAIPSDWATDPIAIPAISSAYVTVMGMYTTAAGGTGLSVGLLRGTNFSSLTYGDLFSGMGSPSESEVLAALSAGASGAPTLVSLVADNLSLFPLVTPDNIYRLPLWNFSDARRGGSVKLDVSSTSPLPEPSTALLLAAGLGSLGLARRFRRAARSR